MTQKWLLSQKGTYIMSDSIVKIKKIVPQKNGGATVTIAGGKTINVGKRKAKNIEVGMEVTVRDNKRIVI